jgi:hypothetical protein
MTGSLPFKVSQGSVREGVSGSGALSSKGIEIQPAQKSRGKGLTLTLGQGSSMGA